MKTKLTLVTILALASLSAQAHEYKCTINQSINSSGMSQTISAEGVIIKDDGDTRFFPTNDPTKLIAVHITIPTSQNWKGYGLLIADYGVPKSPNPVVTNTLPELGGTFELGTKRFQFQNVGLSAYENIFCELQ